MATKEQRDQIEEILQDVEQCVARLVAGAAAGPEADAMAQIAAEVANARRAFEQVKAREDNSDEGYRSYQIERFEQLTTPANQGGFGIDQLPAATLVLAETLATTLSAEGTPLFEWIELSMMHAIAEGIHKAFDSSYHQALNPVPITTLHDDWVRAVTD